MAMSDDRILDAIDQELSHLFSAGDPVPHTFTARVMRRVQECRWSRGVYVDRVFWGALTAAGIATIIAVWSSFAALTTTSGDAVMAVAIAGLVLTGVATVILAAWSFAFRSSPVAGP
jgi:hypothetical protein